MGGNHKLNAGRTTGAARPWLGTVRRLSQADAASVSFQVFAPAWKPGAVALGYFLRGHLRGVAYLLPLGRTTQSRAEIRVAVDERWRRCGIGTLLMDALLRQARQLRVDEVYLRCHALNEPMQVLAERFGAEIGFEDCQAYGRIRVTDSAFAREG